VKSLPLIATSGWRTLVMVSTLAFLALSSGFSRAPERSTGEEPSALVMIQLASEADLQAFTSLGLEVYCRLYTPAGGVYLLVPADTALQERLRHLGYPPQILEADIQGTQYYLLYGLPASLIQAQTLAELLVVEGRQAVARLTPDQITRIANLGIKTLPLIPQPLVFYPIQPQNKPAIPSTITPYPGVQGMIDQVTSASLQTLVGNLSGEWSVSIDGSPYTLQTRYTYSDVPVKKATKYAYEYFQSLGLNTGYDYYTIAGAQKRSVLAEQSGLSQPGKIMLLTAHIDDTSYVNGNPLTLAPGADDNATGSAAVLLIATILRQYSFNCTLRYALFSGEEQGLYGSRAYAQDVFNRDENIIGVLNLDMLGYNTPGTGKVMELHTRPDHNKDLQIANLFSDVIEAYNLNLTPQILQDGLSFSDHQAFWEKGYAGILAIEDWEDHTPHYHQTTDRLGTLQMSYYSDFVKAALGTYAHMGCLAEGQLTGMVTDLASAAPVSAANIQAIALGNTPEMTTSQPDGSYQLNLAPDTYTVTVSADNYPSVDAGGIEILAYQTTHQDFSLCQNVQAASFVYNPLSPDLDETVVFTATAQGGTPPYTYAWDFGDGNSGDGQVATHVYQTRGFFSVNLSIDNACAIPQNTTMPLYVDPELIYLPMIAGNTQP
jgi:hypothetical protein